MKHVLTLFLFTFISITLFAQGSHDDITGVWYTTDKEGTVLIFKHKGKYYGKALTGPEVNNYDLKNPDPEKRKRKLKEIIFLQHFTYSDEKKKYVDGRTYNTRDGKTYKCWIKLKDKNHLELHGYVGISLLGKSVHWTRKS